MDQDRKDDAKPQDQAAGKPTPSGKLDDKTSKAQEDAAKERAEKGGYQ
ncbi:hypothetical protein [Azospirillum sp.]